MIAKIIVPLLILLSFFTLTSVPNSWNICIGDGCDFTEGHGCESIMCLNETVGQHINERSELFNAIFNFQQFIILAVIFLTLLVTKKDLRYLQVFITRLYYRYKFLDYHRTKLFYYLSKFIFQGLLNPKTY